MGIIRQISRKNHVSEKNIQRDMKEPLNSGWFNPTPAVQAKWAAFHYVGKESTLEEFILWAESLVRLECDGNATVKTLDYYQ